MSSDANANGLPDETLTHTHTHTQMQALQNHISLLRHSVIENKVFKSVNKNVAGI